MTQGKQTLRDTWGSTEAHLGTEGTRRSWGALFTIARTWKQLKCPPTEEWIKKMWHIYTMEYYSAIKTNKIMPFAATRMDLEIVTLSEVSQTQKDKCHMISLICEI